MIGSLFRRVRFDLSRKPIVGAIGPGSMASACRRRQVDLVAGLSEPRNANHARSAPFALPAC
jgi:hypothetical protein